jgi:hypothetical protein
LARETAAFALLGVFGASPLSAIERSSIDTELLRRLHDAAMAGDRLDDRDIPGEGRDKFRGGFSFVL